MKLAGKLGLGVAALVVVVVAAVMLLVSNLDSLVKKAIESIGPEITKVSVRVKKVSLSPRSGEGSIAGLVVGNPPGFKSPSALALGELRVKLDPASLASDVVVIRELVIQAPDVHYEQSGKTTNLEVIQHNVDESLKGMSGGGQSQSGGKKLVIENLYVRSGTVHVTSPLTLGKDLSAPLPDIHLKDVGKNSGGATAAEVSKQVLAAVVARSGSVAGSALADLKKKGAAAVEDVGKSTGDKLKGLLK